jgi:branched-chain amino acid transport system permease protein
MLLVGLFGLGLATVVPGLAQAEGEAVAGTLQTSRSGPIEGVQVTVETADGEEVDQVESDENGRWSVELPGPGQYVVSIDAEALPEGVTLSGEDSRTVTVDEGRPRG